MSVDVHERLRRLLFLVPYVRRHPGISVEALAEALSVKKEALLEELELLAMVGRPPFQPDDYIDVHVENDRVYVDLDQRLSAPPRLTSGEAAALFAAASVLGPAAGETVKEALDKLERVLPPQARERARQMSQRINAASDGPSELAPLRLAIAGRREVTFDYFSQGRGVTEPRRVRPAELINHRGQWYLAAIDAAKGEERLFRVDRLQHLALTEDTFSPLPERTGSVPSPAGGEVRVRFTPAAAPYVRERFGADARLLADGGVEVTVTGASERWLVGWVLSFGGDARVLEPAWAQEAVVRAARALLQVG